MMQKDTSNFFSHFIRGAVHYGVGGLLTKFLVFGNVVLILAVVDLYQYGVYKLAFSVFLIINGLLLSGLNGLILNDIIHYQSLGENKKSARLFFELVVTRITLGLLATAIFYFGADLIGTYYSDGISFYLKVLSALFLIDALVTIADIFFKVKLDFLGSNLIPLFSEISKLFLLLYFAFATVDGLNILRLCIATVLSSLLGLISVVFYMKAKYKFRFYIPESAGGVMLFRMFGTYGKWAIAKSYVSTFVDNARLWLVKIFISTEAVAIFSVAMSMAVTIKKFIPTQSVSSLIPKYIKNPESLRDIYIRTTKYLILIFVPTIIISFILVPVVVPLVFPKYLQSIPYFRIIIFSIAFSAMALNKQIIYSLRRQRFLFFLPALELLSTLVFGLILIPRFGLYGTSVELILTEGILFAVVYYYLIRALPGIAFPWSKLLTFDDHDRSMIRKIWQKTAEKIKLIV